MINQYLEYKLALFVKIQINRYILRTASTDNKNETFFNRSDYATRRMFQQNRYVNVFKMINTKICRRHFHSFRKFYNTYKDFVDFLII